MIFVIICIAVLLYSNYVYAEAPVCEYTPIDGGDPESVQLAQLNAINCLIKINQLQFKDGIDAIKSMHNDSMKLNFMILNALNKNQGSYSVGTIIGYFFFSILCSSFLYQLCKIIWFLIIQKVDRIATFLLVYHHLKAQWWDSASPTYDTLESMRRSQPVPFLLVVLKCCRCKTTQAQPI
jgi:hypothetical protein